MFLEIAVSILLLLLTHLYYSKVHLTKKKMLSYTRLFEQAGFKVKLEDYKLLGSKAIDYIVEAERKHNNPMYFHERELTGFDVVVSSLAMRPFVQIINLELVQGYFNTNTNSYQKYQPIIANLRRVIGSGIAFSEGQQWKKKRKVISNVFHFEFLHSLIPKMIKTLDEYFDEFDKREDKTVVLLDMFQYLLATFMIKFFFGSELKGQTLDGVQIPKFITKLMFDVNQQGFEPVALALGPKFLELGLRAKDRDINRRVKLFSDYAAASPDSTAFRSPSAAIRSTRCEAE